MGSSSSKLDIVRQMQESTRMRTVHRAGEGQLLPRKSTELAFSAAKFSVSGNTSSGPNRICERKPPCATRSGRHAAMGPEWNSPHRSHRVSGEWGAGKANPYPNHSQRPCGEGDRRQCRNVESHLVRIATERSQ